MVLSLEFLLPFWGRGHGEQASERIVICLEVAHPSNQAATQGHPCGRHFSHRLDALKCSLLHIVATIFRSVLGLFPLSSQYSCWQGVLGYPLQV